jgi:hypothetical protein
MGGTTCPSKPVPPTLWAVLGVNEAISVAGIEDMLREEFAVREIKRITLGRGVENTPPSKLPYLLLVAFGVLVTLAWIGLLVRAGVYLAQHVF